MKMAKRILFTILGAACIFSSGVSHAQESAYADLDACVKQEQLLTTAKGAGLGTALFGGMKDDAPKAAAIGAVAGGAARFVKAYYTAADTCYQKNRDWIPASQIERGKSLVQTRKAQRYKPSEGIKTYAPQIEMAPTVAAGSALPASTNFAVLTPNDAETKVLIERRLYLVEDGKDEPIRFPGAAQEERTLEPGTHVDRVKLPIPAAAKPGMVFKMEFRVSAADKPASVSTATTTVQ
jgi:hypothetical protein